MTAGRRPFGWGYFLVAAVLGLAPCAGPAAAVPTPHSPTQIGHVTLGGAVRTYVVFRPPTLGSKQPAPLVVAMHGYTVDATWMETTTHFDALAARAGFVVVYPQGMGNAWNAGRCCGHDTDDDVTFIKDVVDRLVAGGGVDPKHVFATGMSNGGLMAQRLACDAADHITAVASVSGSLVTDSCNPSRAISVLEIHGIEDDIVPYMGGAVGGLTDFPPTMANMQRWATLDGCAPQPAMSQSGITTTYTWSACRDGASVVLDAIAGAGHSWFGPDEMTGEPDATQVTWDFFSHAPALP